MRNEIIFLLMALADIAFIFAVARTKTEWLLGIMVANLFLVSIFGSKLITIFGFVTNAGNAFYACAFLATHFFLERRGKKDGLRTIMLGIVFTLFFSVMIQLAVHLRGSVLSEDANAAIATLFTLSVRVTAASMIAFIFAQYVNVSLYEYLKEKTKGKHIWLRSNLANILGQLIDSVIFFSIAFFNLPAPILIQSILVGWGLKTLVGALGTPFLILDAYLDKK